MSSNLRTNKTVLWTFIGLGLIVATLFAVLAMANSVPEGSPTVSTPVVQTNAPDLGMELPLVNTDGQWVAEKNGSRFVATVVSDSIEIRFESGNTSMIYWNGTFESSVENGATIVSDVVPLDKIVLSNATSKDFQLNGDSMTFVFEAMGVQETVELIHA